ncbi:MAG: SDR family oxidoreductase [Gammaproteobacteria bacterium]|nr:SDR family oxidoreductase [Gammaproteobacteria bacterium]
MNPLPKYALITGANQGLGKVMCDEFINCGVNVIATSRTYSRVDINFNNESLVKHHLDVTDEESVIQLFEWVKKNKIKLSILINNSGIGIFKPITKISLSEWELVISTNLNGAFLCSREAYSLMKDDGGGRIINIGSVANKIPLSNNGAYGASKWGLRGLSGVINEEGKFDKIRCTHVTLGAVATEIWDERPEFSKSEMLDANIVAKHIINIALLPLDIRLDSVEIYPEKGVL